MRSTWLLIPFVVLVGCGGSSSRLSSKKKDSDGGGGRRETGGAGLSGPDSRCGDCTVRLERVE